METTEQSLVSGMPVSSPMRMVKVIWGEPCISRRSLSRVSSTLKTARAFSVSEYSG